MNDHLTAWRASGAPHVTRCWSVAAHRSRSTGRLAIASMRGSMAAFRIAPRGSSRRAAYQPAIVVRIADGAVIAVHPARPAMPSCLSTPATNGRAAPNAVTGSPDTCASDRRSPPDDIRNALDGRTTCSAVRRQQLVERADRAARSWKKRRPECLTGESARRRPVQWAPAASRRRRQV